MVASTNVNFRTVVHKTSNGMLFTFPDVCKTPTPAGPIPIPYPNFSFSTHTTSGSKTVSVDGNPVMVKNSNFCISTGDEPGVLGGIFSGVIKGKAQFISYSFDVKFNNQNVCRLGDLMISNKRNTPPWPEIQPPFVIWEDLVSLWDLGVEAYLKVVNFLKSPEFHAFLKGFIVGTAFAHGAAFLIGLGPIGLLIVGGVLVASVVLSGKERFDKGQNFAEIVVGTVVDTFKINDLYIFFTNKDIVTGESLNLTTEQRYELLGGVFSLGTVKKIKPMGSKNSPNVPVNTKRSDPLPNVSKNAPTATTPPAPQSPKPKESPKNSKPEFLQRTEDGNKFNKENYDNYEDKEVYIEYTDKRGKVKRGRLDSYNHGFERVSRKNSQLSDIKPETAKRYINELKHKYYENAKILDVPSNKSLIDRNIRTLEGKGVLEIPPQNKPIPQEVIMHAIKNNITIRDTNGHVYTKPGGF